MDVDSSESQQLPQRQTHMPIGSSPTHDKGMKKLVLLGQTGSGKSTLGNCLLGKSLLSGGFDDSKGTDSCTDKTRGISGRWFTNGASCEVRDTPGLDESSNRDSEHIENIVEHLKEGQFMNTFVLGT